MCSKIDLISFFLFIEDKHHHCPFINAAVLGILGAYVLVDSICPPNPQQAMLGSDQRYMICDTVTHFACCASQKTHFHARVTKIKCNSSIGELFLNCSGFFDLHNLQ